MQQGAKRRSEDLPSRSSTVPEGAKRQHINLPQLQQRLSQLVGRPLNSNDMMKITGLQNFHELASSGGDFTLPGVAMPSLPSPMRAGLCVVVLSWELRSDGSGLDDAAAAAAGNVGDDDDADNAGVLPSRLGHW